MASRKLPDGLLMKHLQMKQHCRPKPLTSRRRQACSQALRNWLLPRFYSPVICTVCRTTQDHTTRHAHSLTPSISAALVPVRRPRNRHIVQPQRRFLSPLLDRFFRRACSECAGSIPAHIAAVHERAPAFGVQLSADQRQRHRPCVLSPPQPPGCAARHRPAGANLPAHVAATLRNHVT